MSINSSSRVSIYEGTPGGVAWGFCSSLLYILVEWFDTLVVGVSTDEDYCGLFVEVSGRM